MDNKKIKKFIIDYNNDNIKLESMINKDKIKEYSDKYPLFFKLEDNTNDKLLLIKLYIKNNILKKILNLIDDNEYQNLVNLFKKYNLLLPLFKKNLLKEESENNFGHKNVIPKGDIYFPNANSYNSYLNKQEYLKDKKLTYVDNHFKLYKYNFDSIEKPFYKEGPTFIFSLFMPNGLIIQKNYSKWTEKYFSTQINCILIIKYYFPNCNIRFYFDWYMLEKGFLNLSGNDESIMLTKQITEFYYNDYEKIHEPDIRKYLNNCYLKIKELENEEFENGLERFLYTFYLSSKISKIKEFDLDIDDTPGEFFSYKFNGPFIEFKDTEKEGHITNGYIGQQVRYLSLRQTDYLWNNNLIIRPKHLVFRDAHANCPAYNDYLWIKSMNDISLKFKRELYLIPTSISYEKEFHDKVKCDIDGKLYYRSAIAGIVQFINSTDDNEFIKDDVYNKSIGVTFLLDLKNELPILKHRHIGLEDRQKEYGYGIEEYINSAFFNLDIIKRKSLYFSHYFSFEILQQKNNLFLIIEIFLIHYLIKIKRITSKKISQFQFLREIEKLRNDSTLKNNQELRLLLSIYPTKYHFVTSIFNDWYNKKLYLDEPPLVNINTLIEKFLTKYDKDKLKYLNNLSFDNLKEFNITCENSAISSSLEWCINPYLEENKNNHKICSPAYFYSGFYFDKPPSLNLGILRQPSDLEYAINSLDKNKLLIPLNKSDYKLHVENDNFFKDILKNIDDKKCNIKPVLQNIIFKYNDKDANIKIELIINSVSKLNKDSKILVTLIWKALNYYGYDVKPECLEIDFLNENDYYEFNNLVIDLANISGWPEYAANILLYDNETYDNDINLESIIDSKSELYKKMLSIDHKKYKMKSYDKKYLKIN